jgi:Rod binding domain-containing protein
MMTTSTTPPAPPDASELVNPAIAKIWRTAQDFEAMTLGQLLAPMFQTVDSAHGAFGGGDGEAAWQPMLTQELAKTMARHGGLGLAAPVFRQMLHMQEKTR